MIAIRHNFSLGPVVLVEIGFCEDRLQLLLCSQSLTLVDETLAIIRQNVVEHDDERFRLGFPRDPAVVVDQSCFCTSQEEDQILLGNIAGTPNHKDRTVLVLPLELFHRGLLCVSEARAALKGSFCLLDCNRTLIKKIDFFVRIYQETFA